MVATDFEREGRLAIQHWQEELERLEAQRADVETRIGMRRAKIQGMERAIHDYRELHGLPVEPNEDAVLGRQLRDLSVKDMVLKVLEVDCLVEFNALEVSKRLTQAGMFDNVGSANDNVYSTLRRYRNLFEKVSRGRYRLIIGKEPTQSGSNGTSGSNVALAEEAQRE